MPIKRIAYMPVVTYPDSPSDDAISAVVAFTGALGLDLHATAFAADIPRVPTPIGGFLLNVPEMIRTTEEKSLARCHHIQNLISERAGSRIAVRCMIRKMGYGGTGDSAAVEARYFDLAVLPWSRDGLVSQDLAQSVVFGAGRPTVLVPAGVRAEPLGHVALAWDGSRVAARALADVLPLIAPDGRVTVLTVSDEKALGENDVAERLAAALKERGLDARAQIVPLQGGSIAVALQEAAIAAGAACLAMGGFGHSRLRDFILGGATQGVFTDLRLPVLLSH